MCGPERSQGDTLLASRSKGEPRENGRRREAKDNLSRLALLGCNKTRAVISVAISIALIAMVAFANKRVLLLTCNCKPRVTQCTNLKIPDYANHASRIMNYSSLQIRRIVS